MYKSEHNGAEIFRTQLACSELQWLDVAGEGEMA
jgi:hypothetical protein